MLSLIEALGAQTRKCATKAPLNSPGVGYGEVEQDSKLGSIDADFQRRGDEYTPSIPKINGL